MKRSNLVGSCLLQVTAFAQVNCRLVKLLKTNQMWLKPLNFSQIGRKPWVKKWVFLSFSSVFQSCLNYVKARLSCKGVMTIYQSQNIKVSPSVWLSGPSVLWLRVSSTGLLKMRWEKEKLLITNNFSFFHSVFYQFGDLSELLSVWKRLKFDVWERVKFKQVKTFVMCKRAYKVVDFKFVMIRTWSVQKEFCWIQIVIHSFLQQEVYWSIAFIGCIMFGLELFSLNHFLHIYSS